MNEAFKSFQFSIIFYCHYPLIYHEHFFLSILFSGFIKSIFSLNVPININWLFSLEIKG